MPELCSIYGKVSLFALVTKIFLNNPVAWLNNCVGYYNHRYFFLYMMYMVVGVLFLIIFGFEIAYLTICAPPLDEPELIGHPVKFNQTGALTPVVCKIVYLNSMIKHNKLVQTDPTVDLNESATMESEQYGPVLLWRRRAIIYMTLVNVGNLAKNKSSLFFTSKQPIVNFSCAFCIGWTNGVARPVDYKGGDER